MWRTASTSRSRPARSRANIHCPVIILSDQALGSRIEAFHGAGPRQALGRAEARPRRRAARTSSPIRSDATTRHAPPGSKMAGGKYPDRHRPRARRMGPPERQPEDAHGDDRQAPQEAASMLAAEFPAAGHLRRRRRATCCSSAGAAPTARSARAVGPPPRRRPQGRRACTCATSTRCPTASRTIFAAYKHVVVVEMNDEGLYGYGQLAMLLRARYADPEHPSPSARPTASPSASAKSSTGVEKHLAGPPDHLHPSEFILHPFIAMSTAVAPTPETAAPAR